MDDADEDDAAPSAAMLQSWLALQQMMLDRMQQSAREVALPWSGDVSQWIRTFGQIGLVNFNVGGSSDPQMERAIGSRYSYGRQLGRMLDVIAPLVAANKALIAEQGGAKALADFEKMVAEIERIKQPSVEDIVEKVERWRGTPEFGERLRRLQAALDRLAAAEAPAPAHAARPRSAKTDQKK